MTTEQLICTKMLDMMENTSFASIKASELAKEAGISRSTFYFYFDSVYAVLDKLEDDLISGISDDYATIYRLSLNRSGRISCRDSIRPTIEFVGRHLRQFRILSGPNGSPRFQEKLLERAERVGRVLYSAQQISPKEIMLKYNLMAGAQWYIYKWWANHESDFTAEDIIDYVAGFLDKISIL